MSDSGAVGMGEVRASLASLHVEVAISAVAIKGDERFFLAVVRSTDFLCNGFNSLTMRCAPEETSNIHENSGREMFAFFGGKHVHGVLTEDTRATVHHEKVLTLAEIKLLGNDRINNIRHFHEIQKVITSSSNNTCTKLSKEKEE